MPFHSQNPAASVVMKDIAMRDMVGGNSAKSVKKK